LGGLKYDRTSPLAALLSGGHIASNQVPRAQIAMATSNQAHIRRIIRYVAAVVAIELALFAIAYMAPAMKTLLQPVYWIVLVLFVVPIWHAARSRGAGHDRRHSDRRN
jgi:hypothetical protein